MGAYDINNSESAASIILQIGPLTIGNTIVTTLGCGADVSATLLIAYPYLTLTG